MRILPTLALLGGIVTVCVAQASPSLYQESTFQPLTADRKAYRVGDAITVLVYENASAASSTDTSAQRVGGVNVGIQTPIKNNTYSLNTTNQFDGTGQTQRSGKLLASITVSVVQALSNGELVVAGEQLLEINKERQQIKIEGRVRPQDISELNAVLSYRLADAKISYVGRGDLDDHQRPSWWQKLLLSFGL